MADTVINVPGQALYGRNPAGASAARDEWWNDMGKNDAQQGMVQGGMGYANTQAQTPRGPQATENAGLANNEASGAGGHQQGAIGLAGTLARGQQPSAAAMQLQSGLNQASQQQSAMAAGARGSAGLATAGANMNANRSNLQQNAYAQGGMLRSRDMTQGRGMLNSMLGQQRDQDNARIGQANEFGQANADQNDKYALGMGAAATGLGEVGNAQANQDMLYYQGGMGPVDAQSEADQQRQRWLADANKQANAANLEDS